MSEESGGVVPAVFRARGDVEAAIERLRAVGFEEAQLGLAVPDVAYHQLEVDPVGKEELRSTARGILIGMPLGSIAGIALLGIAVGGLGALGAGGILLGAIHGAFWGLMSGGFAGLTARVHSEREDGHWSEIPLSHEDILLVVRAGARAAEAHDIVVNAGGECFCFLHQGDAAGRGG